MDFLHIYLDYLFFEKIVDRMTDINISKGCVSVLYFFSLHEHQESTFLHTF